MLAAITGVVHFYIGVVGARAWLVGDLPNLLVPFFILVGVLIFAGILAVAAGWFSPRRIYTVALLLMIVHLIAYIDWHILHMAERTLDLGELGHGHVHDVSDRDFTAASGTIQDVGSISGAVVSLSVVLGLLAHAVSTPMELVTKGVEVVLIGLFLILRWAENGDVEVIRWAIRWLDISRVVVAIVSTLALWMAIVLLRGWFVPRGFDPLLFDLFELLLVSGGVLAIGWFVMGDPIVSNHVEGGATLRRYIPGFESKSRLQNTGVAIVYLVVSMAIIGGIVGFVPAENDHHDGHEHDHVPHELEDLMDITERHGIEVDRNWTVVHYSEYHGGDAVLFDYFTEHEGDRNGLEEEIEIITELYVDAVADDGFDGVVVFLGEARTQADESYVWWEIEQEWVMAYLDGEWTWAELVERIFETYEKR